MRQETHVVIQAAIDTLADTDNTTPERMSVEKLAALRAISLGIFMLVGMLEDIEEKLPERNRR